MERVLYFDWLERLELLERLEQLVAVGRLHRGSQEGHLFGRLVSETRGERKVALVLANQER